jgi:hypothetical protein
MIRYRPASRRPGRNRPSFKENPEELGGLDDDEEVGRGGRGDAAVAYSRVAMSSDPTGVPQEEQKRTAMDSSLPQVLQVAIGCSADSVLGLWITVPTDSRLGRMCCLDF